MIFGYILASRGCCLNVSELLFMFIPAKRGFLSNVFVFHLRALYLATVAQFATCLVKVKDCQHF